MQTQEAPLGFSDVSARSEFPVAKTFVPVKSWGSSLPRTMEVHVTPVLREVWITTLALFLGTVT